MNNPSPQSIVLPPRPHRLLSWPFIRLGAIGAACVFALSLAAPLRGADPAAAPAAVDSAARKKAEQLVLPGVGFREATVAEAIAILRAKAAAVDPAKTGVNIVLKPGTQTNAHITLELSNVPLIEAVQYVAALASLEVHVEPNALVLQAPKPGASQKP